MYETDNQILFIKRGKMSEKEKMLEGKIYDPTDEELTILRTKAHRLSQHYNTLFEDDDLRNTIIDELIPSKGEGLYLQGPIYFDYGIFTSFGKNCYANFNFTVLDVCPVNIGSNVFFGPNCSLMTPLHPLRWQERNIKFKDDKTAYDNEYAKPINIGDNCWISANVVITGGVTIGEGCVIGAGSVVTKDIPANSLAAGNPCKVIREINEKDSIKYKKELF
ncbi:putative maltose O-acetyltransferase [Lachnospiraceae bacterium oral taxon 082 str. F0431]|nr:putative maltose O-acetyltransferase [Lachnospiraceae bacterium oral taxon 082 str. F0431]